MTRAEQGRAGEFGILLIDKPAGPTSHDVVGWVRWALRERSVGHCGTLDPAATGLLVVCVGAATKLVEHLTAVDKRYLARFVLGRSTTTADAEGQTIAEAEVPDDGEARAAAALAAMVGELELPPPAYSAISIGGRRAHELARAGEAPELPPRAMTVTELELVGHGRADGRLWIDADLTVSKGTYVRSLAEELGRRVGLPAHLGSLRRLACGDHRVDDPLAVAGLVASELPSDPGRPPRWRIGLGRTAEPGAAEPEPREATKVALRACLQPPWRLLPFPHSELAGSEPDSEHGPLLERLLQGQRLRADARTCAVLGLGDDGLRSLVDRAAGLMILVRCEPHRGTRRVVPIRTLRFEPAH